jgi:hypothetical protein
MSKRKKNNYKLPRGTLGIFQGDVIIKAMIDLSIDEMRKNPWLLDNAFDSLKVIPYISDKYGQANINAAKEWFANNKIDVYLRPRDDQDQMPFVSVFPAGSTEKVEMKTMGDMSPEKILLLPNEIGKPIPYIVKPFTPTGYNPSTGVVTLDPNTPGLNAVNPGMVLVNPENGNGYIIENTLSGGIIIEPGIEISATQLAVVPKHQFYEARIKHTFNQENYSIGCYAHGDPQNLIWLHTIVYYAIMRYRQTLLEGNGFAESVVSSGEVTEDPNYPGAKGEKAYVRFINITGQVEQSWIDAPKRFIENLEFQKGRGDLATAGIKIVSNEKSPAFLDTANDSWATIARHEDDDDEN